MLDATLFDNFDTAGTVAHGLPGEAYTSDSFMQFERTHLFANQWVFVGYAHKLSKAGDVSQSRLVACRCFCCVIITAVSLHSTISVAIAT